MKTLVVLPQLPMPEGGALGRSEIGLLRGLRAHGLDARALAAHQPWESTVRIPADLLVDVVAIRKVVTNRFLRKQRQYVSQIRRPMSEYRRGGFAVMLRTLAHDIDVLHLEEAEEAYCDEGIDAPSLVRFHSLVRRDRSLWQKGARWGVETLLAERAAARRHLYLAANSPEVAAALRIAAPHAEVVVAPLALDPSYYPIASLDGPPTAGIIGTASWPPTKRAIQRLVQFVWPEVLRLVPSAQLLIAGRRLDQFLPGVSDTPGVKVLGEVESAIDFLHRLSVLLYPLDRGSGMKVKVLESIACGVPVVTTPEGAEGIDGEGGVVIDTDDRQLAAATAEILTDEAQRRERGSVARRAFEKRYAPLPATEPLVDLYRRMAGG